MTNNCTTPCKFFKPKSETNTEAGFCCKDKPNETTNPKTGQRLTKVTKNDWCGSFEHIEEQGQ